jgi:hypothetical protein
MHVGEIIEADSTGFEAECPQLYGAPEFGSFVRADAAPGAVYGVVVGIATAATDASRRTQALHLTPDELAGRMPQLQLVLRTCFSAVTVGHDRGGGIRPYLPARPPEIHRFLYPCTPEEVTALTEGPDYLRILATAPGAPADDALAQSICHAAAVRADAGDYVVRCGKYLAQLFKRDFDRFDAVMRRLEAASDQGKAWERPLLG